MAEFQVIKDHDVPKFVVLPFGDKEAVEDYLDELWALQAVEAFEARTDKRFYDLEEVQQLLG